MATSYSEIAQKHALTESQTRKFRQFLHRRHPADETTICLTGQASKWANLFKVGQEEVACSEQDRGIFRAMADENKGVVEQKPEVATPAPVAPEEPKKSVFEKVAEKVANSVKKAPAKKGKK